MMRMFQTKALSVCAIAALSQFTAAHALAGEPVERSVQIRSVDFDAGIIELFNFAGSDQSLAGWRFCTHDFNEQRRYTASSGFTGVTIEAGTSVFVHFNNDAPGGDPDRVNRSSLGGSFAGPLDTDAYGMQLFFPIGGSVSFGNSAQIADHLQWNIDASGVGTSEARTAQAVSQTLWTANGDFIATTSDSLAITLNDLSGDVAGGPSEYDVAEPLLFDETIDGDASDDPNAPTVLAIALGDNTVAGEVNLSNDTANGDRDFFTITVPAGTALTRLDLVDWGTTNPGFIAVNAGATGFVPSGATNGSFLAGVHASDAFIGDDLLDRFQDSSVTLNSLGTDTLGPGDYTFVVQQTSNVTQPYLLNFVLEEDVPVNLCAADFDDDGDVDLTDFGTFGAAFGSTLGGLNYNPAADFDMDGDVDLTDFGTFGSEFGRMDC